MSCIFCKIVKEEIPSYKIYEDDYCLAFLDIAPVNKGHALVIPKKHFANLEEAEEEILGKLMAAVKKVGEGIKAGLGIEGYNVQLNNGKIAGQVVEHLHFHVIPRLHQDGLKLWPQGKYEEGEAEKVAQKIREKI